MYVPSRKEEVVLLHRCGRGEEAAWKEMIRQFFPFAFSVIRSVLGRHGLSVDSQQIEDSTYDFFHDLYRDRGRRLGGFRGEGPARHYLAVVARTFAHREARLRQREQRAVVGWGTERSNENRGVLDPSLRADHGSDRADQVKVALEGLSPSDRLLYKLLYLDAAPPEAVARIMRKTVNAVYIQKSRLLEKIRSRIHERSPRAGGSH